MVVAIVVAVVVGEHALKLSGGCHIFVVLVLLLLLVVVVVVVELTVLLTFANKAYEGCCA